MIDAALGRVAGVHEVARPIVVPLLAGQRANQRELLHARAQAREVLAQLDAVDAGGDGLELAPRGAARLGIEGVDVAGPARHVEQDARPRGGRGDPPGGLRRARLAAQDRRREGPQACARAPAHQLSS